jgi:Phosphatidylserine/phosphatidylglycerophosphate/cardiolipin synthases and related enzymes
MWNNNLKLDYLADTLISQKHLVKNLIGKDNPFDIFNSKIEMIRLMNESFPSCSLEDKYKILYIISKACFKETDEKAQLVWSGPDVAGLPGRDTEILFEELVAEAKQKIIISIYSISEYASKLLNLLKNRALQGVYIEIYVNEFESKRHYFEELTQVKNNRLFIYDYTGANNSTQALHAKVLTVDDKKSIITSSNLSYNGMDGNLELGVFVNSIEKAKEIRAIFNTLLQKGYFKKVK